MVDPESFEDHIFPELSNFLVTSASLFRYVGMFAEVSTLAASFLKMQSIHFTFFIFFVQT